MEDRDKKKAAEVLKEIDSNLDTVLNILGKLALVAASVKTIIDVIVKLCFNSHKRGESPSGKCLYRYSIIKGSECQWETANFF